MKLFRGWSKFLVPATLAAAQLAGVGLQWALEVGAVRPRRVLVPLVAATLAMSALSFVACRATLAALGPSLDHHCPIQALTAEALRLGAGGAWEGCRLQATASMLAVVLFVNVAAVLVGASLYVPRARRVLLAALLGVAVMDLGLADVWTVGRFPSAMLASPASLAPVVAREGHATRVRLGFGPSRESTAEVEDFCSPVGSEALYPLRIARLISALGGDSFDHVETNPTLRVPERALPLLGARHVLEPSGILREVAGAARFRLCTNARFFPDEEAVWQALSLPRDSPFELLLVGPDEPAPASPVPFQPMGPRLIEETPASLVLEVDAPSSCWLFAADTFDPGWSVSVDGSPETIRLANFAFRAVRIAAGRHVVRFSYTPPGMASGFVVSVLASTIWLSLAWRARRL